MDDYLERALQAVPDHKFERIKIENGPLGVFRIRAVVSRPGRRRRHKI
jgi:hypothetical protein